MVGFGFGAVLLYLHLQVALGDIPRLAVSAAGFLCTESTVLGEARGESLVGQAMVRRVIHNRAAGSRTHPCRVVSRPDQFDGFSLRHLVHFSGQWWQQQLWVLKRGCGLATHFHTANSRPRWSRHKDMKFLCRIGNHKFYLEKTK